MDLDNHNGVITPVFLDFPGGSDGKESSCNVRPGFDPWIGKIPWKRERLPTPVFWAGEFNALYSPWGCKELGTTECGREGMTHADQEGSGNGQPPV